MAPPATQAVTTDERYWGPSGSGVGNPKWTDELVILLKKLWVVDHLSAGKIAVKLGFSSRNAVISKLHRLGIGRNKEINYGRRGLTRNEAISKGLKDHVVAQRINQQRKHRPRVKLLEDAPPLATSEMQELVITQDDNTIPLEQRRTLLELTPFCCRWPVGEPNSKDFFFCGAPADLTIKRPYCINHTLRACR